MSYSYDPLKFQNKYRVPSARLRGYDYARDGWYFVTICTRNREHWLGEIVDDRMRLSRMGQMVWRFWHQIPHHFPNVSLDAFVVMPNHVHGIIIVRHGQDVETLHCNVSTRRASRMSIIAPHAGSIPTIIRSFKSITARIIHQIGTHEFQWQPRFHDRVIRDADELAKIRWYIRNNPRMWGRDRNNDEIE